MEEEQQKELNNSLAQPSDFSNDTYSPLGKFDIIPTEILQMILSSYAETEEMGNVRQLNQAFYKLTTGYDKPKFGFGHKPQASIHTNKWAMNTIILDFEKEEGLTPEKIPSFPWFRLVGRVSNLPQAFWSCLQGTSIHTVDLSNNQITDAGAIKLAKHLQGTSVHTVDLSSNQVTETGDVEFIKNLQGTSVHTIYLGDNQITDSGVLYFAKNLKHTNVHTIYLGANKITDLGAIALANNLQSTSIHTVDLRANYITNLGAVGFARSLQNTQVQVIYLDNNQIDDKGALVLARSLQATNVHEVYLGNNEISIETQELLRIEYPHTTWYF